MNKSERRSNYNPEVALKANEKWRKKNPEQHRYYVDRTSARRFIRDKATEEDLQELEQMIAKRRSDLIDQDAE